MQRAEQLLIKSARDEDQFVEQRQGAADRERVHPSDGHGLETEGPKYALQRLQGKGEPPYVSRKMGNGWR